MSISDTESHPAFYHSKKRIWDFPITSPHSNSSKPTWLTNVSAFCVGGFDSLWKLWYSLFVVLSTCLLFWLAIVRYQEFKAQSFHPRFGFEWDWSFPLNLQIVSLVVVVSLFPLLIYATVSRVGHSANDGISLGRDCLHLHAMLAQLPCFRLAQRSADPEAAERLRSRIVHSTQSLNEATHSPDFESFIIQDKAEALEHSTWCLATRRQLRPFACLIHVLIAFALLQPVYVFQAEQIKNEAIPSDYVWRSNLDWLLKGFLGSVDTTKTNLNYSSTSNKERQFVHRFDIKNTKKEGRNHFTAHPYPTIPPELGPEFVLLTIAWTVLAVRFASPFWFTSRPFSSLLSSYTAITGCYVFLETGAMELLLKIHIAGTRNQDGERIDIIPHGSGLIEPWVCVIMSAAGFLALLSGLMAFYTFGEQLFQRSVTNYANLIMAGEFDCATQRETLLREERGSPMLEDVVLEEDDLFGPSVIAVTTKVWRPPRKSSVATGHTASRAATPSGLSASSDTLRSRTASTLGIHPKIIGKSDTIKSSIAFWPSLVSALSFICLAVTRSCLFGPMLQCYWHAQVKIPLVYVVFSIIYLILWLVLWFGVTVKTSWRFRLLHMPAPSSSRCRFASPKYGSKPEKLGLGISQFAPWPLMSNPAAAHLGASYFWPWLHYQNGFVPAHNGSIAFGASPAPYDGNYGDKGTSGMNSLYGCITDARPANAGGLLREGPPTLSDESENVIQMEYDRPTNYAYLQKGAGLVTICNGDKMSEESYQPYKRNANDPAYVSLASLGRTGSPQRSSQAGSRRSGLGVRVTFKSDEDGAAVDGNNASSDSGVCTNGSGSRLGGKVILGNHPLFVGSAGVTHDRAGSPQGFLTPSVAGTGHGPVRVESDERLCSQV